MIALINSILSNTKTLKPVFFHLLVPEKDNEYLKEWLKKITARPVIAEILNVDLDFLDGKIAVH
eukprot:Awhi_evm1s8507